MRSSFAMLLLPLCLAACGQKSNEDSLRDAANQSSPEAAQVLNGAAENGMNPSDALNQAANAQEQNLSTTAPQERQLARPNSAANPNPPAAGQSPEKVSTNSE